MTEQMPPGNSAWEQRTQQAQTTQPLDVGAAAGTESAGATAGATRSEDTAPKRGRVRRSSSDRSRLTRSEPATGGGAPQLARSWFGQPDNILMAVTALVAVAFLLLVGVLATR